jgi:hypothetical protein
LDQKVQNTLRGGLAFDDENNSPVFVCDLDG